MIVFFQPSLPVTTWRSLWPGQEMRRRGHDVRIDTMDAGYGLDEVPRGELTVVHLTPSLFATPRWLERLQQVRADAGRLIVTLDDDWTRLLDLPTTMLPRDAEPMIGPD